ncbi:iron-sulfur cluster assembly scaffold protein [Candidatus Uhrbacteria bacterium]|nr:iron-sulfur cluster assembly scaffold protein [Candidatus Uhrbacteria bacterium]
MDPLYREQILGHWRNPQNFGKLDHPTNEAFENNPLCGDEIGIQLNVKNGVVEDIRFHGVGCAISIAATSLLTEVIQGKKMGELKNIKKEDVFNLLGVTPSPSRVKCALLGWSVLQKVLE